jgi:hypothetical protein
MQKQRININKRFNYLRQLTSLVAKGSIPSAIILRSLGGDWKGLLEYCTTMQQAV